MTVAKNQLAKTYFRRTLGAECLLLGHLQVSDLHSFALVTEYKKLKKKV